MAKKALVSMIEPRGQDDSGYRVLEVVEVNDVFETHSNFVWKDCPDEVNNNYWYDPRNNTFKKLPDPYSPPPNTELAVDAEGYPTEKYEWDWNAEIWTKVAL